jgi:hypothetical protein
MPTALLGHYVRFPYDTQCEVIPMFSEASPKEGTQGVQVYFYAFFILVLVNVSYQFYTVSATPMALTE